METIEKTPTKKKRANLGSFKVVSGNLVATDPCYEEEVERGGNIIRNVLNGEWKAYVGTTDGQALHPASLTVHHATSKAVTGWEKTDIEVGVDSGQVCIFDTKFFAKDSEALGREAVRGGGWEDGSHTMWYRVNCFLTLGRGTGKKTPNGYREYNESETDPDFVSAGVLDHGANSSTCHGDGVYSCFVKRNKNGKVVAVQVRFGGSDW